MADATISVTIRWNTTAEWMDYNAHRRRTLELRAPTTSSAYPGNAKGIIAAVTRRSLKAAPYARRVPGHAPL